MIQNWKHHIEFYERVDRLDLHGLHFQHIELCERRAWMYLHHINFAQWHERVAIGAAKHETSYTRDHSTEGLFGLAPDRVDWDTRVVYESKGTGGAVEASNNQTAFYAVMLARSSGQEWKAVTHILSSRRRRAVALDEERLESLWQASERLERLAHRSEIPKVSKFALCETCALEKFCGYE